MPGKPDHNHNGGRRTLLHNTFEASLPSDPQNIRLSGSHRPGFAEGFSVSPSRSSLYTHFAISLFYL